MDGTTQSSKVRINQSLCKGQSCWPNDHRVFLWSITLGPREFCSLIEFIRLNTMTMIFMISLGEGVGTHDIENSLLLSLLFSWDGHRLQRDIAADLNVRNARCLEILWRVSFFLGLGAIPSFWQKGTEDWSGLSGYWYDHLKQVSFHMKNILELRCELAYPSMIPQALSLKIMAYPFSWWKWMRGYYHKFRHEQLFSPGGFFLEKGWIVCFLHLQHSPLPTEFRAEKNSLRDWPRSESYWTD